MKDSIQDVLSFWFEESVPSQWVQVNEVYDAMVRERFAGLYQMAVSGVCDGWRADVDGNLALVLLFDQFPRNMFRGTAKAFSSDPLALSVARGVIDSGFDHLVSIQKRKFFYFPFEHSESLDDQETSVSLFEKIKDDDPLGFEYALRNLDIIKRFGRFPHRNVILGRESTSLEKEFLLEQGMRRV